MLQAYSLSSATEVIDPYHVRSWGKGEGLPSDDVLGMAVDEQGNLVVSTTGGLARFDGNRFWSVESPRLSVFEFEGPGGGHILPAANEGEYYLILGRQVFQLDAVGTGENPTTAMYADRTGAFWLSLQNGTIMRVAHSKAVSFELAGERFETGVAEFWEDGEGRVWVTGGSRLFYYDGDALVPTAIGRGSEELRLGASSRGRLMLLADEHLFGFKGTEPIHLDKVNSSMAAYYNHVLLEDSKGYVWLGSRSNGLRRWDPSDLDESSFIPSPASISALCEDPFGNLWVGTAGGGIVRLSPGLLGIVNRQTAGLMENQSLTISQDAQGRMWFANRDGGINWLNEQHRAAQVPKLNRWDRFSVRSIVPAQDEGVWVSTTHGLLHVVDNEFVEYLEHPHLTYQRALDVMFCDRDGAVWGASRNTPGVVLVQDGFVFRFGEPEGVGTKPIRAITQDADGTIWIGGDDAILRRFDGRGFQAERDLNAIGAGVIQLLCMDADGAMWIGTRSAGLVRPVGRELRRLGTDQGLLTDNVTRLMFDRRRVWLGGPAGIYSFAREAFDHWIQDPQTRLIPWTLGKDEGLAEVSCPAQNQPAVWRAAEGLLWFTTRQGVIVIDPERVETVRSGLSLRIVDLRIDGERSEVAERVAKVNPGAGKMEIRFSAVCLTEPSHVKVQYRLAGIDADWQEGRPDLTATYDRAPPGRYQFEVRAELAGRAETQVSRTMVIEVEAAWWQHWGVRLGVILVVGLALGLGVRRWSNVRLRRRVAALEQERALERERTRIAQNIHDDLGAGLTRISLLTQTAEESDCRNAFDKVHDAVGDLIQSMEEIVWAVNPKNDNLENVATYISEYAQSYLSDLGLRCRVKIPAALPDRVLPTQFRHHLFLACKEAIHNVVKHAQAQSVILRLEVEGSHCTVVIEDDGVGFGNASTCELTHNGVDNMHSRMAAIGGNMTIKCVAPHGTQVMFSVALPIPPPES